MERNHILKDRAVLRFLNGKILKGYLKDFSPDLTEISFEDVESGETVMVNPVEVKAIFFVRSFDGDRELKEKKSYGIRKPAGKKVFIKFKDNESLVGFLEGEIPWEKGFFLSKQDKNKKGFFLVPADMNSNNIKIYIVVSSVMDVTVVP